jgi:uncharacterized protein (DUF1330 family)
MAKGYWITFYRSISDPAALATYAKIAGPAVISNGGRFLARGGTVKTYEQGIAQRTVAATGLVTRFGADIALPDLLVALATCGGRRDFSKP